MASPSSVVTAYRVANEFAVVIGSDQTIAAAFATLQAEASRLHFVPAEVYQTAQVPGPVTIIAAAQAAVKVYYRCFVLFASYKSNV